MLFCLILALLLQDGVGCREPLIAFSRILDKERRRPQNNCFMRKLNLTLALLGLSFGAFAQYTVSKLTVPKGDEIQISDGEVQIDTLIMEDKSKIVFLALETRLTIKHAFIGKKCSWDASGARQVTVQTNEYAAPSGMPGRDLHANVMFHSLGYLTINTAGANGKNGFSRAFPGDGKQGGDGGNGGQVSLTYRSPGFPITFDEGDLHSIYLKLEGGRAGVGGSKAKPVSAQRVAVQNSHNAPMDLWGHQSKAATGADATLRASRADHGGSGDIPQPMFITRDNQGNAQYAAGGSTSGTSKHAGYSKLDRPSYYGTGISGKAGSFMVSKID